MRLLLTEPLPLLTTTALGAFAEDQPLPLRYGDLRKTRINCIRCSATKFIAAAHPMEITRVFVGDLETKSFAFATEAIGGVGVCVITTLGAVPLGTKVTASGVGKRHAVTGALLENAGDIADDVMALAGRSDAWFGQLRSECSSAGITLAGSIVAAQSIRDAIDSFIDSAAGMWCPGMARLYPADFEGFRVEYDVMTAQNVKVSASMTDTADILRLSFDYDEAEGRNQSFMQFEASPQRYGGLPVDVALPHVRSAAVAEANGRRLLTRYAGERYAIEFDTAAGEFVRPGVWATFADHPQYPFASPAMKTAVAIQRTAKRAHVTGETIVSVPTIALTKHSLGSNSIGAGGVEVTEKNGVATFLVKDPTDKPFVGAYVSLDGSAPKKTNGAGEVDFIVTKGGVHQLDISAPNFVPQSLQVTLLGTA